MHIRTRKRQARAAAKLSDLNIPFQKEDECLAFLFRLRFPSAHCPHCGRLNAYHKHSTKPCYTCNCGRSHIFPMKGTIFENSRAALPLWFRAFSLLHNDPNLTIQALQQSLGVTYATAWRMVQKIGLPRARAQRRPAFPSVKHLRSSNEDLLQAL